MQENIYRIGIHWNRYDYDGFFPPSFFFSFPPSAVPGRRQNTIVVKVPGHEDSHNEDGESGSEASDSISNSGQLGNQNIGNNVTLITLNSEGRQSEILGQIDAGLVSLSRFVL